MPITAITYQNEADSLNAAYRPIVFRCKAKIPDATVANYAPPVVYADVYINDVYYKTLSKTAFVANDGIAPEYEFDVQDAIQEVMSYNLPPLNGFTLLELTNSIKKVFVKFRNTYLDANGFIVSELMAPVQGTSLQVPVSGLGTKSNEIYCYNSTIQHEDSQDFKTFLSGWKTGAWNPDSFPLTKRPKIVNLCTNDSSYFPITTSSEVKCFQMSYRLKGQSIWKTAEYCYPTNCVVSEWSEWSACVNDSKTRTRTIITPAAYGGTQCPVLSESQSCSIPIPICEVSVLNSVIYIPDQHTINGTITSEVWLEYSTNSGTTWNRVVTPFPAGTTIITSLLPKNADLQIRLVSECNESLISNVVEYDYIAPPPTVYQHEFGQGYSGSDICQRPNTGTIGYSLDAELVIGSRVYYDVNLTNEFYAGWIGFGKVGYKSGNKVYAFKLDYWEAEGVTSINTCP